MSRLSVVSVADRGGFYIFAAALRSSDHFDLLEGPGPFTVFAPADAAFNLMSSSVLDNFLNRDRERLHVVLGYHFAAGRVAAARFAGKRIRAIMRAGGDVMIDGRAGLKANGAGVVKPDLDAANGVVHGIDALLWPRELVAPLVSAS
ncbi:MAG: fasciclin domain-containing protein [Hyphomonadaceae bacterium]|nr:fasciclin domain-containing protein [Hyphomonadaceae bacterium]